MSTKLKQELIETGKYLLKHELAWGTSGNMSARVKDHSTMLMTASGTYMGDLKQNDFVECNVVTGEWTGDRKPSKEIPMHKAIYQQREDANVILHSSPFYTTLVSCSNEVIHSELFIETMYYLENVGYIDYHHPGSQDLGDAVYEKAALANTIMMRNHGMILFDKTFKNALMRLETLEMACRMMIEAKQAGITLNKVPERTVSEFRETGVYKPRKN